MDSAHVRQRRVLWLLALAAALIFRTYFGLTREFFFEDETQIFLIGLRHYATGAWPYFGADVVWTRSEIPGALQALLVSLPLHVWPVPESPFVLLNLLSFGALCTLAWYIGRRVPTAPRWLVWGWLLFIPWTLEFSAHVINPSYVLVAAVVFFLGFFEAMPTFSRGLLPPAVCFAFMGASVTWMLQIHMSWPLLLPYAGIAWLAGWRTGGSRRLAVTAIAFLVGAAIPGSVLLPTLISYQGTAGTGGTLRNLHPHVVSPVVYLNTLARFLSFPSLEIMRFIATDGAKRLELALQYLWLVPIAAVVWVAGLLQPVWMLVEAFRRRPRAAQDWTSLRWLVGLSVALVYLSYWLVMEPPQAHAFYVLAPIAFIYAAECWARVDSRRARHVAAVLLTSSVVYHAGIAWAQTSTQSLYKQRAVAAEAIRLKQPEMFGHRRAFAIDAGPVSLQDPTRPYAPERDLVLQTATWTRGLRGSVNWHVVVDNQNPRVAYRDILYFTTYRDTDGRVVAERHEFIKNVFQPGLSPSLLVNDGFVRVPFATATMRLAAAEALVPIPARDHP